MLLPNMRDNCALQCKAKAKNTTSTLTWPLKAGESAAFMALENYNQYLGECSIQTIGMGTIL